MPTHPSGRVLVIGELEATRLTCSLLREADTAVTHLLAPQGQAVVAALEDPAEDPVVAETTSLFRIGHVVDVSAQTAIAAMLHATARHPTLTFGHGGAVHALVTDGELESRRPVRCGCGPAA